MGWFLLELLREQVSCGRCYHDDYARGTAWDQLDDGIGDTLVSNKDGGASTARGGAFDRCRQATLMPSSLLIPRVLT